MTFYCLLLSVTLYAVASSAQVTDDDVQKFADASNNLATSLYGDLIKEKFGNICLCPPGLMTELGPILYGARGETQQELYNYLGYKEAGLPLDKVPTTYKYYFTNYLPLNNADLENYTLWCGNLALISDQSPVYPEFQENAKYFYNTIVANVDYSQTDALLKDINTFVYYKSHGKIKDFIDHLDSQTSTQLMDFVYLNGKWEAPFHQHTTLVQPFHSLTEKEVQFMQVIHSFPYYENNDFQATFLPYVGGNVGFLILLPKQQNGLSSMEKTMTPSAIIDVLNQLQPETILVQLPKFKVHFFDDSAREFYNLGARLIFDSNANFSGITDSNDLKINYILHQHVLEVDESSQEDETTSDTTALVSSTVLVDHPFMFAVVDRRFNLLFYIGRIIDV